MEKKRSNFVFYSVLLVLAVVLAFSVITRASSFVWKPSPKNSPLYKAYKGMSLGMGEKEVYATAQKQVVSEPYVWTYEDMKADYEERAASDSLFELEKVPEAGVAYVQWPWDGNPLDSKTKIPDLLAPADYEEHAFLHVQLKDGKVRNAWYTYYRYLYRSGLSECRTRGFYYSKSECLAPDKTCPRETKYENLQPCKGE